MFSTVDIPYVTASIVNCLHLPHAISPLFLPTRLHHPPCPPNPFLFVFRHTCGVRMSHRRRPCLRQRRLTGWRTCSRGCAPPTLTPTPKLKALSDYLGSCWWYGYSREVHWRMGFWRQYGIFMIGKKMGLWCISFYLFIP